MFRWKINYYWRGLNYACICIKEQNVTAKEKKIYIYTSNLGFFSFTCVMAKCFFDDE